MMMTILNNVIRTVQNTNVRIVYNLIGTLSVAASKHIAELTT
jgi:hypothetical protein